MRRSFREAFTRYVDFAVRLKSRVSPLRSET